VWRRSGSAGRRLLVLLPGRGDRAEDFASHGFVDAAARLPVDCVAVDATLGYYMKRTIVTRLLEDVIAPARQAGYRRVWLVGISMGGLGALATAQQHETDIEGILLLAPFLGDEEVIDEISARGRLARWTPSPAADGSDDYHRLWRWLKR